MKKCIILLLSVLLFCSGCGTASLDCLSETDYVAITCDSRPRFMVKGEILIEPACENLMALTLEETKNTEPIECGVVVFMCFAYLYAL